MEDPIDGGEKNTNNFFFFKDTGLVREEENKLGKPLYIEN